MVILCRQLREAVAVSDEEKRTGQRVFSGMAELRRGQDLYEYTVLVTSLADEVLSVAQYRDERRGREYLGRAKEPVALDRLHHPVRRCQILARTIAVIYN